jgi:hypothetical protein
MAGTGLRVARVAPTVFKKITFKKITFKKITQ